VLLVQVVEFTTPASITISSPPMREIHAAGYWRNDRVGSTGNQFAAYASTPMGTGLSRVRIRRGSGLVPTFILAHLTNYGRHDQICDRLARVQQCLQVPCRIF
jgi:hypothetical protein